MANVMWIFSTRVTQCQGALIMCIVIIIIGLLWNNFLG